MFFHGGRVVQEWKYAIKECDRRCVPLQHLSFPGSAAVHKRIPATVLKTPEKSTLKKYAMLMFLLFLAGIVSFWLIYKAVEFFEKI